MEAETHLSGAGLCWSASVPGWWDFLRSSSPAAGCGRPGRAALLPAGRTRPPAATVGCTPST